MLSLLTVWSTRMPKSTESNGKVPPPSTNGGVILVESKGADTVEISIPTQNQMAVETSETDGNATFSVDSTSAMSQSNLNATDTKPLQSSIQRFPLRSIGIFHGQRRPRPNSTLAEHERENVERRKAEIAAKRKSFSVGSADRRAQKSALDLQKLIVGPSATLSTSLKNSPVSKAQLAKLKSELMQPKTANRVIAKLRALPMPNVSADKHTKGSDATSESGKETISSPIVTSTSGPIHAVCLEATDAEIAEKHFSKLTKDNSSASIQQQSLFVPSVATASLESLVPMFQELHVVDLISSPDLGLGQPGDSEGILSGAVPTAETVIDGVMQITPQLMALGYATGKAMTPNHAGVYPPLDRISAITYWWGLEVCLPEQTLQHLSHVPSISHAVINLLTALSVINEGVREILPFVRYISQFIDFEWNTINAQDKGNGVVCAATWIMPAALVPRPWDFPDPPSSKKQSKSSRTSPAVAPRTGQGYVEDINVPPMMLPTLVVTPPSVIKGNNTIAA